METNTFKNEAHSAQFNSTTEKHTSILTLMGRHFLTGETTPISGDHLTRTA